MKAETTRAECVSALGAELGEGAIWHALKQCLYWVDIIGQRIHEYAPERSVQRSWYLPKPVSAVIPVHQDALENGLLCFLSDGLYMLCLDTLTLQKWLDPEPELHTNRLNDATIGADGSLWFGSMDNAEENSSGAFYHLTNAGKLTLLSSDICITNGPALTADGSVVYFTDTLARKVYQADSASQLDSAKLFVELKGDEGYPDGMCCDNANNLWLCHWGSGMLSQYSPNGELLQRFNLPVSNITKCAFGGEYFDDLYITTARKGLNQAQLAEQPLAGGVFKLSGVGQGFASGVFSSHAFSNTDIEIETI